MAKVSIIIPVFNREQHISQAIDSVLAQTFNNYEIIVVDDGSTDRTRAVVEKYIQTYSRTIKYFHQKNGGVSSARNLGLEKARGDFICFLDSDDFLVSNDSLSKRAKFLLKNSNIDIVTSDMEVIYELDKPRKSWLGNAGFLNFFGRNIELRRNEEIYFDEFFFENYFNFSPFPIHTNTIMVRRSVIGQKKFREDLSIGEDADFWFALIRNKKIGYINQPLACYRKDLSILTKNSERYCLDNVKLFSSLIKSEKNTLVRKGLRKNLANAYFELSYFYRGRIEKFNAIKNAFFSIFSYPFTQKYYRNLMTTLIL